MKSLCAFGLLAGLHAWSCAQSSVQLYGIVDVGVEHLTNVGASGEDVTRMTSLTGTFPSRMGFRGSEDLGGGLRAIFTAEQGFSPSKGTLNQGGRIFGRQAFVGLAGAWGQVTLGRQYSMLYWSFFDSDVLGPNLYGIGSVDPYVPNARVDNTVAYRGKFGGFDVGATYSFGRDELPPPGGANCAGQAADSSQCRQVSAMVKYDSPSWGIAAAFDELRGGPGAVAAPGTGALTTSSMKDTRSTINGYVKFNGLKIGAGWLHRKNDGSVTTPKSDLWYLGAAYPLTPSFVVDAELFRLKFKDSSNKATLGAVRGTYSLSKRSALYGMVGHISNDGSLAVSVSGAPGAAPLAGESQTGVAVGIRHSF